MLHKGKAKTLPDQYPFMGIFLSFVSSFVDVYVDVNYVE